MASKFFPKYKEHALAVTLGATAKIVSPVVTAYLIDGADYTYSDSHEFLSDVPSGARVSSVALGSLTFSSGVLDAADATFSGVSGDQSEHLILAVGPASGANDSNTRLVVFIDGATITGSPVTPNSGDINVAWDNGANKIAKLGS
jgi:hypothetical protein